jgi:competence transcription factor ComK
MNKNKIIKKLKKELSFVRPQLDYIVGEYLPDPVKNDDGSYRYVFYSITNRANIIKNSCDNLSNISRFIKCKNSYKTKKECADRINRVEIKPPILINCRSIPIIKFNCTSILDLILKYDAKRKILNDEMIKEINNFKQENGE